MSIVVTFAGPVGSSKTPISNYLSTKFNLPIFNNDAIRTEVVEDFLNYDIPEFTKRRSERFTEVIKSGTSFILDASFDREWQNYSDQIMASGYKIFVISLDLSHDFLLKLYQAKNYTDSINRLDQLLLDHQNFLDKFSSVVNLSITDANFADRLTLSEKSLASWIHDQQL